MKERSQKRRTIKGSKEQTATVGEREDKSLWLKRCEQAAC